MMNLLTPTEGKVTSRFGWRLNPFDKRAVNKVWHSGTDIANILGTPIHAAYGGAVIFSGFMRGYGNAIIINHPNLGRVWTLYGHMSELIAKEKFIVRAGDIIGKMGSTGYSTGSHLHFEVRLVSNLYVCCVNPEKYLGDLCSKCSFA